MPDERDMQNAAPSADGDTLPGSTAQATATQEPPAAAQAEAGGEAPASPAPDPQPRAEAEAADAAKDDAEGGGSEADGSRASAPQAEEPKAEATKPEAEAAAESEAADGGSTDEGSTDVTSDAGSADSSSVKAEAEDGADGKDEGKTGADTSETTPAAVAPSSEASPEKASQTASAAAADAEPTAGTEAAPPASGSDEPEAPQTAAKADEPKPKPEAADSAAAEAAPSAAAEPKPEAKPPAPARTAAIEASSAEGEGAEGERAEGDKAEGEGPDLDDPTLQALREAKESGSSVSGKVIGWNRGGFHVVIDEVTAFCPASEMELGRPRSPDTYMDREMEFKVAKFQRRGRRVVLSRSEVLKAQRDEILARLQPGTTVKGSVTSLPEFGAFVDLGGVEGLVHVSEISRTRVKQPRDVLQLGQEVEVKILKIEKGGDRISLSMKELEPDPWKGIAERYPRGSKFTGKILRHADFGMFVELEPTVEGLVHVSQLEPGQNLSDESLQPGQTLEGWVREVEPKRERISLSLREVPDEDPWKSVQSRFPEGETVEGTVESIAPFGVFITLAPGLTGLLPNSQTGLPRGTNAARAFRPGQSVEVQVLTIDSRRKRISLGRPGAHVEATKADLQEFRKQQKEQEKKAPSAMEAAFARLGLAAPDEDES